jgi:hypothetical protein
MVSHHPQESSESPNGRFEPPSTNLGKKSTERLVISERKGSEGNATSPCQNRYISNPAITNISY